MNNIVEEVQKILNRQLTNMEFTMVQDLNNDYNASDIVHYIYMFKFKDRPIDYARVVIIKNCQKKGQPSGSDWLDKLKKKL